MTCGDCRSFVRLRTSARYGLCGARKALSPIWALRPYPVDGGEKTLDHTPQMPDDDGEGCVAFRPRPPPRAAP